MSWNFTIGKPLDHFVEFTPHFRFLLVYVQGCGSGSTWTRINFPAWIRIQIQERKIEK